MLTVGIDPGKQGAVCFSVDGKPVYVAKVPTVKAGSKKEYDVAGMAQLLSFGVTEVFKLGMGEYEKPGLVVIERTQGGGGGLAKGATAAHSIGRSSGLWQGMCIGKNWAAVLVRPVDWQRLMFAGIPGQSKAAGKGRSILAAGQLFPGWVQDGGLMRSSRCRKPDDNYADAALLASYGHRLLLCQGK